MKKFPEGKLKLFDEVNLYDIDYCTKWHGSSLRDASISLLLELELFTFFTQNLLFIDRTV